MHVFCIIMTQCFQKSICDSPLNAIKYIHVFDITESFAMHWYWLCCSILLASNLAKPNHELEVYITIPNGQILVDSPLIRRRDFTLKVRRNDIDFERRIHMEFITLIQHGNLDVDSTFKLDEILMSSPRRFFDIVLTSNRRNFCTRCLNSIIF